MILVGNIFGVNYLHLLSMKEPLKYNLTIIMDFFTGVVFSTQFLMISQPL